MATIIFDFDSTLINCESLEKLLEQKLTETPNLQKEIERITIDGMNGKISFAESLRARLKIAAPTKHEAKEFGEKAIDYLTTGAQDLIKFLRDDSHEIWVISGSLIEIITPACLELGIKRENIKGIKLLWSKEGNFLSVDEFDSFSQSKFEAVKDIVKQWSSPTIMIGDSMSDYQLFEKGFADDFILYIEHFFCEPIFKVGVKSAKNMAKLRENLCEILKK